MDILNDRAVKLPEIRKLTCLIAGVAFSACPLAETGTLESPADLRWKNRVILVNEANDRTISELADRRTAIDERHILWFCEVNGQIRTNYQGGLEDGFLRQLHENYFERTGFPVLLIGKDGGIKSRDQSLEIDDYLIRIDAMPMRQAEMARPASD